MDVAFIIALALCIVTTIGWLRSSAERNRLHSEVHMWRSTSTIESGTVVCYGADYSQDSARQRQARAQAVFEEARRTGDWEPLMSKPRGRK